MANSTPKHGPILAGRPPFATDEPDSVYDDYQAPRRRQREPKTQDNRPDSAYDVYDNYLNDTGANGNGNNVRQSGYGDLGMGFLTGDMEDDSDDETIACSPDAKKSMSRDSEEKLPPSPAVNKFPAVQIVAPKPGYAAPVSALTADLKMPEPAASPVRHPQMPFPAPTGHPQMAQVQQMRMPAPAPLTIPVPAASPRSPFTPPSVPSTPHPLQAPATPITPAFARPPPRKEDTEKVKFSDAAIMRGKGEEKLLPKRGEKGDDFWRRFSMVVKEEGGNRHQVSSWLQKSQSSSSRMSRWIWCIGIVLLIIIGGSIGLGIYASHKSSTTTTPEALGGSESEGVSFTPTTSSHAATGALAGASSTSLHVSPTNTVAKRWALPIPEPTIGLSARAVSARSSTKHKRMIKRAIA